MNGNRVHPKENPSSKTQQPVHNNLTKLNLSNMGECRCTCTKIQHAPDPIDEHVYQP